MNALTARPELLKQANLSFIRKVIKAKGTATRAEIAKETKISSTTVRSLLTEMMQNREIESIGYDASSGGRKAERYSFQPGRYMSVALCIADNQVHMLLINACGEIVETTKLAVAGEQYEPAVLSVLDDLVSKMEIKSIGIGVPGVVDGDSYWRQTKDGDEFYRMDIGKVLAQRYKIPIIMENDLNATAIGFSRCYAREFPGENPGNTNLTYLHFEENCVSAGFIAGGRIIRGNRHFAGELGLVPMGGGKLLDECLVEPMDDVQYANLVITIIGWISGILNPQYVVLGGPALRKNCIGPIGDGLSAFLPDHMSPEILYSPDVWHDYYDGMAYLTAGKMFEEVQFIKESL